MKSSRIGLVMAALVAVATLLILPSCGFKRKLLEVTIIPQIATYLTPNAVPIDFRAYGSYIHPPDARDITAQVTWNTDVPDMLQVNFGGVPGRIAPNGICGIADISATASSSGSVVVGFATVTINDPTNPNCPGGSTTQGVVTVSLGGTQQGTVTSSPAGINCPALTCGAQFTVGQTIALTATANATHAFTGWTGCTSMNGNTCSVLVVQGSTGVTATFN